MESKKIGVCAAQVPFVQGGAEALSNNLCSELIKRGYEVDLLNIPFKWYPPNEILKNALVWRLLDLSESDGKKIDLLICTKFPTYVAKHPNKIVWLFHQHRPAYDLRGTAYDDLNHYPSGEFVRKKIQIIDNRYLNESKKIFTISKNVSDRLLKFNNIQSDPLYPPSKNSDKFFNDDYEGYVLYPSRLDLKKRQDLLINAMKYTKSGIKCKIVGDGPAKERYTELTKKLNVTDKIEFLGWVDEEELINLYSKCLAVFFSPLDEDYGFITIESFLSEKPVITTFDSGGPLEFVDDHKNGFVVRPEPREIAKKLDYLYENKDIAKKMGKGGRRKIKNMNISWDNVIDRLVE